MRMIKNLHIEIKMSFSALKSIFFILLSFYSCEGNYLIDLPDENKIVIVNGFFSPDDTLRLHLSFSESVYKMENDSFINNANVSITLPDNSTLSLSADLTRYFEYKHISQNGYYRLNDLLPFQPGEYTLKISHEKDTIYARDIIPNVVPIDNAEYYFDSINDLPYLLVSFTDPADRK
jgi:hypothetical protein